MIQKSEPMQPVYDGFNGHQLITRPESRTQLPYLLPPNHSVPVWKIIGKFVQQDLSKVSLPVILCEPLNILQRSTEQMTNYQLLEKAAVEPDSCMRLVYSAIFGLTQHANNINRFKKPFNPILGETFEYVTKDYQYIAEQVSHHPPQTGYHFEGNGYSGEGLSYVVQQFKFGGGTGQLIFTQPGTWKTKFQDEVHIV